MRYRLKTADPKNRHFGPGNGPSSATNAVVVVLVLVLGVVVIRFSNY